jgi:hypothetical protein
VRTGSGKTGLLMVIVEEALRSAIPVIMLDIKGDLPNLLLTFPNVAPEEFAPWVDEAHAQRNGHDRNSLAQEEAERWHRLLADWQLGASDVADLRSSIAPRVLTPPVSPRGNRCTSCLRSSSPRRCGPPMWLRRAKRSVPRFHCCCA